MKTVIKLTVLSVLLLVLTGTILNAQVTHTVYGNVKCTQGTTMRDVTVEVLKVLSGYDISRGEIIESSTTNDQGNYSIDYTVHYGFDYYVKVENIPYQLFWGGQKNFTLYCNHNHQPIYKDKIQ